MTPPTKESKQPGSWKEEVEAILRNHLKRVYYNGSTDVIARQNKVIPNDTKLGEVQIEKELSEALQAIIEANKKWLIGQNFPKADPNHDSEWENGRVTGINELREEQRRTLDENL